MKTIISGSRTFDDYALVCKICGEKDITEVVTNGDIGAGAFGEKYADENGIAKKRFPVNWGMYGKSAEYKCNELMVINADSLIVFWDGRKNKSVEHLIGKSQSSGLSVTVVNY